MKFFWICLYFVVVKSSAIPNKRRDFLRKEQVMSIGGNITLDVNEIKLNNLLMKWKHEEIGDSFDNQGYLKFSHHFYDYKDDVKSSKVYHFIKAMPKGAALHVHSPAMLSPDYFLNVTYRDYVYICFDDDIKFKFAKKIPQMDCNNTQWQLLKDYRKTLDDVKKFDAEIKSKFMLNYDPNDKDTNINNIWKKFRKVFKTIYPLVSYKPVWEDYLYTALAEFRNDNIIYVEIRTNVQELYDLDGSYSSRLYFVEESKRIVEKFVEDHPDFIGAQIIYSKYRGGSVNDIETSLNSAKEMKKLMPDFIAGFDLNGQEDKGNALLNFLPVLIASKHEIDYFFHAGETKWYGTPSDENLIDAVLLGTKRIGHAYALLKHPLVIEEVRSKDICLEVNVVSNNVLGLVKDVHNHPLASFIAQGLPVVLSSDDGGFWGADPLSTDFYVAFVGVASRSSNIRLFKQLALNSLKYSALSADKKAKAFELFNVQWQRFVSESLQKYCNEAD